MCIGKACGLCGSPLEAVGLAPILQPRFLSLGARAVLLILISLLDDRLLGNWRVARLLWKHVHIFLWTFLMLSRSTKCTGSSQATQLAPLHVFLNARSAPLQRHMTLGPKQSGNGLFEIGVMRGSGEIMVFLHNLVHLWIMRGRMGNCCSSKSAASSQRLFT